MAQPRRIALVLAAAVVAVATVLTAFLAGDNADGPADATGTPIPIADTTGAIRVDVPGDWAEIQTEPSRDGAVPRILAAPDAEAYKERRDARGLEFLYTPDLDREHIGRTLDEVAATSDALEACERSERRGFDQRGFKGSVDVFSECGTAKAELRVIAARPPDAPGLVVISIQAASEAERDLILGTFAVTPGTDR